MSFPSSPEPVVLAPAAANPALFIPVFEAGPGVIQADGFFYPIALIPYCLSMASAQQLAAILKDLGPTIYLEYPLGPQFGGGASQTAKVPWFSFPDGLKINAGLLANYWRAYGNAQAFAERQCRADLTARFDALGG